MNESCSVICDRFTVAIQKVPPPSNQTNTQKDIKLMLLAGCSEITDGLNVLPVVVRVIIIFFLNLLFICLFVCSCHVYELAHT